MAKGIEVIVLNEDTTKTANLWRSVRTTAAMVYMSPEMALSKSFQKLWKESQLHNQLMAVVVNEAHCIDKWGDDDFHPLYCKLNTLWNYTGYEIPIVTCTATAWTLTFDLIWSTLGYGNQPFWGLNVGADWPNIFYITWLLSDPKNPSSTSSTSFWAYWMVASSLMTFQNVFCTSILKQHAIRQFNSSARSCCHIFGPVCMCSHLTSLRKARKPHRPIFRAVSTV